MPPRSFTAYGPSALFFERRRTNDFYTPPMIEAAILWMLNILAAPMVGLTSVFLVSFVSATLLPLASEPAVFAVIKANPSLIWPTIALATLGNTLGGIVDYWMGLMARRALAPHGQRHARWLHWTERFGPSILLLGWLPVVGDPLCTLAGWKKLPFWPCTLYMAIGKGARYLLVTWLLMNVPNGWWQQLARLL